MTLVILILPCLVRCKTPVDFKFQSYWNLTGETGFQKKKKFSGFSFYQLYLEKTLRYLLKFSAFISCKKSKSSIHYDLKNAHYFIILVIPPQRFFRSKKDICNLKHNTIVLSNERLPTSRNSFTQNANSIFFREWKTCVHYKLLVLSIVF